MIDIKDISGKVKLSIEINEGSIHRFELMKEDYVQPKFSLVDPVYLGIGDKVEIEGEPFYITELMYPSFNISNAGYDYDLRFDSHYFRWKNHILFYDRQGNKEATWSLTRSPEAHLGIVVSNIRSLGFKYKGKDYQAVVDSSVDTVAKLVQYENTNIIDALTKIAEAWECEWWVEGDKIYLGRCEHGKPINLEIGKELSSMSRSQSKETYANRIYAFGSTRNIPSDYRSNTGDGSVVEGVVTKRLMLPVGIDHIDAIEGLKDSEVVDRVVVFDTIYPRTICTMTFVEPKDVTETPEGGKPETYKVYRFKDSNFHFSSKYILPNQELRIEFQSGSLAGMDFGVAFNPDKVSEDTEAGQVFEIVRSQDYGQWLPADPLIPTVGSQFVLYGFDTKFISDQLLGKAEQELLEKAKDFVKKLNIDPSTYNCNVSSYEASGYDEQSGVLLPSLAIDMKAGQKVNLINKAYFKNGRVSRVIGFEKKLDIPYNSPTYIVGETSSYSRIGELEEKIDNIQFKGNTYVNQGGGGGVYVIKKDDPTAASDENVFSALRTLQEINQIRFSIDDMYLRKDINDTAHGVISFDQKIGSSIFLDGYDGWGWEIRETGGALLDSVQVRSDVYLGGRIGSPSFASGFTGWGWEIDTPTASGTVDNWTVRKSMKVYELVYSQIYGLGGSVIVSDLNKILYVETCQGFYRCYMDSMDSTMRMNLRKDDIVRIQRSQGINIRYFYGEVLAVTPDYFDLKIIDGEDYPQLGDVVFRFGNKTDKNRQGIIYLTSSDDNAPYIDVLDGITDMSMFEKVKVRLGNYSGILTKKGVQLKGYGIYAQGAVFEDTDIYLQDGTTVEQQFIIMNGKFESTIEGIKNDMSLESGNILLNSSFGSNTNYWSLTNNVHFINVGGSFIWLDGAFYTEKIAVADIYKDGSKNVLRILNNTITQSNTIFKGEKSEGTYSFAFYYKVLRPGTLSVGFTGKDLFVSEVLEMSDGYQKLSKVAQWDGTGDFSIGFTGEILIYGVSLFNDALADAQIKLQTQIDQTAEYIKLLAKKEYVDAETGAIYTKYDASLTVMAEEIAARVTRQDFNTETGALRQEITSGLSVQAGSIQAVSTKVDNVQKTIDTAGWINTTQGNTLFAAKTLENGQNIISYINQTPGNTTIASNRINLYGAVSFSMLSDYTTVNSRINGKADSSSLGDLAYQNYVYSRDLAKEITDTISAKVSPGQLRNYAFANGASITKGDLISALQTEITGKLTGTATSSGNKLASVIVNGQTLIAGGYIQANLVNADEIWCTSLAAVRGTVGGFSISQYALESGGLMLTAGQLSFKKNRGVEVIIGGVSESAGNNIAGYFCNDYNSGGMSGNGAALQVLVGSSNYSTVDQLWINCDHSSAGGFGSKFSVSSRYFGDANKMNRTCINVGKLLSHTQVKSIQPNAVFKAVWYDDATGFLCFDAG